MRVAVVVVDHGSRKKREPLSRGRRLLSEGVVRDLRCWSKVERICLSSIGGPRIRCTALSLPMARMAQNGADEMAQINPLLMKYHKSGDNESYRTYRKG